jgi:hypothetical protein
VCLCAQLRDLVPPTQQQQQQIGLATIGVSDNPEASSRRPKHVVLADTINLLKTLRQQVSSTSTGAALRRRWRRQQVQRQPHCLAFTRCRQ